MKKNKQVVMSEKKFKKELLRKRKVKEKKKLTNEQVNTALSNIELLETRRREAINLYLETKKFTRPVEEDPEDKWKAVYFLGKTKYILEKVNLSDNISATLEEDLQKFAGLYQIVDIKTKKKWQIFQVNFLEKEKEFKIIKLLDSDDEKYKEYLSKKK